MAELQEIKGRVGNVCKEWLVREDGALAYQLQSREINDHYKGNRTRNAIVRQDFPTAVMEQIKEKENAERQAQIYHQMVNEQEEQDARYAMEIASKLKREAEAQKKLFEQRGELLARRLAEQAQISQEADFEQMPPPPRNHPKPKKPSAHPEQYLLPDTPPPFNGSNGHLHYASLDLSTGAVTKNNANGLPDRSPKASTSSATSTPEKTKYAQINLHSHTPDKQQPIAVNQLQSQAPLFPSPHSPGYQQRQTSDDICDSIRHYDMPVDEYQYDDDSYQLPVNANYNDLYKAGRNNAQIDAFKHSNPLTYGGDMSMQRNVPDKYSAQPHSSRQPISSNGMGVPLDRHEPPQHQPPPRPHTKKPIVSYQSTDNVVGNADDIDRIRTLTELGLPADEIQEIDRRITQEQKDEELARQLQDQESGGFDQEERDRMLAIEAQDKELAKMLQERERAKAKRAKEKAKLKKELQRQQQLAANGEEGQAAQSLEVGEESPRRGAAGDVAYSSPVDTLSNLADGNYRRYEQSTPPQESISPDQQYFNHRHQPSFTSQSSTGSHLSGVGSSGVINDESYSNPLDLVPPQHRHPNSVSPQAQPANGRRRKDDDNIYVLPVDDQKAQRPSHLDIRVTNKPSPPKAHLPEDNIAAMIDPTFGASSPGTYQANGIHQQQQQSSRLTPDLLEYSEPSSTSPVPPYMPIQGTRRNASLDKKKKSKDRCAQQ